MSEENSNKKNEKPAAELEKKPDVSKNFSDEERKKIIEQIKANLFLEDQESVQLYASLIKNDIP